MKIAAFTAVAALSVMGIGAYAIANIDNGPASIDPANGGGSEETQQPTPEGTPAESPSVEQTCSASNMPTVDEEPLDAPDAVAELRLRIIEDAMNCDYEALEGLALAGDGNFSYSYGVEKSPSRFWQNREREARTAENDYLPYLRGLVSILRLPHCTETFQGKTFYVWPRVHCNDRKASDWNDLKGLYTDEQIDQMRTGDLYYGYRVGILENGDWEYFIAGD